MPILRITPYDGLVQSLRIILERISGSDICDPDTDFIETREDMQAAVRDLQARASSHGNTLEELYDSVVAEEEARADFQTEQGDVVESD